MSDVTLWLGLVKIRFATVPVENLHVVPESVTDREAVFAEPLAAACRIVEQQVCCSVQRRDLPS